MKVYDVYKFYNDYVKVIYSEIEARDNSLPIELLFETHSAFDHLKRYYVDNQEEDITCEKAISHLQRGVLDAFKLKLKYFNDDVKKLRAKKIDFDLIDSGSFVTNFIKDRREIIITARDARLYESNKDKEEAFDKWMEVSIKIDEFYKHYFIDTKLHWAKIKTYKFFGLLFLLGLITGLISSGVIAYIFDFIICR